MGFSWKYLRVFCTSLFVCCGLFTSALHAEGQVRVRLSSPPPNLMKYLLLLDENEVFSREPGWVATEDVDLFVVFTSDFQDLDFVPKILVPVIQVLAKQSEEFIRGNQFVSGVILKEAYGDEWPLSDKSDFMFFQVQQMKAELSRSTATPGFSSSERNRFDVCMMAGLVLNNYDKRFSVRHASITGACAGLILADR